MKKKITAIITVIALMLSMALPAMAGDTNGQEPVYTVAGDFLSASWEPSQNPMTKITGNEEGYDYYFEVPELSAGEYQFKITDGTWVNSWGNGSENYKFTLSQACPVTILFNSETKDIKVEAEYLYRFELKSLTVVGNGSENWLNGKSYDPSATENDMTETAPGVYEITLENVAASDGYQYKIAANHNWNVNWGKDGVYNGDENIPLIVEKDGSTVVIKIDINNFNFDDKTGTVEITHKVTHPDDESETTTIAPETTTVATETTTVAQETTTKKIITTTKTVKVPIVKVNSAKKKKSAKTAKISLKKLKKVSGYQIQISRTKKFKTKNVITKYSKKASFTVKKLQAKKKYYVRARAYVSVGKKKIFGNWSATKQVKFTK